MQDGVVVSEMGSLEEVMTEETGLVHLGLGVLDWTDLKYILQILMEIKEKQELRQWAKLTALICNAN